MTDAEVLKLLQDVGAFRAGHFVLTSGMHADTYINKDAMYPSTKDVSRLCEAMAEKFTGDRIDAVIGPAMGAVILSTWTAHLVSELEGREVMGVYADKDGEGGFIIKRGYDKLIFGKRVLIVEDLTTTGGSIKKVVEAARAAGAHVAGAIAVCNRGDVTKEQVGNPDRFEALLSVHLEQWPAATCDLCARGIPVNTDIGHGKEFLKERGAMVR